MVVTTGHGPLKFGAVACGSHLPLLGDWHRGDLKMEKEERGCYDRTGRCNSQVRGWIL